MNTQETEVIPAHQAITIYDKPQHLMRQATDVAGVCKDIALKCACNIQGKKYLKAEGWMAIAMAHGCIASSRDVQKVEGGFTAIGEIKRISDGIILSTAEGFVGRDEKKWGTSPEYACRAMAQTRAISRACRAAFAHVVVMMDAGLSTTPLEEVPEEGFAPREEIPHIPGVTTATKHFQNKPTESFDYERFRDRMLDNLIKSGLEQPAIKEYAVKASVLTEEQSLTDWPVEHVPKDKPQMDALVERIKSFIAGVPLDDQPPSETQPRAYTEAEALLWEDAIHPIKKVRLGDMEEKDLRYWFDKFNVTTSYMKDGVEKQKSPASIAKDQEFRDTLDKVGKLKGWV